MARAHDDNWDLASSVGATATMVASCRAMATNDPRGLINDPLAAPLVRAVGLDFFSKMMDGEVDFSAIENVTPVRMQAVVNVMAVPPNSCPASSISTWTRYGRCPARSGITGWTSTWRRWCTLVRAAMWWIT